MNTLPRAVTAQFFDDPKTYWALRRHWSALMNSNRKHELSAAHHLLYLVLCGKDWRKGFTPITNRRKLDNGAFYDWGLFRALQTLRYRASDVGFLEPFGGLVTPAMAQAACQLLPVTNYYTYQSEQFRPGHFPFEAYAIQEGL
jgi:hypothetical protein